MDTPPHAARSARAGAAAHAYSAADLERIAGRLGDIRRVSGGWLCRCPAHDDRRASLSLSLGEGNRLLYRCHAGCSQDAVRDALRTRDLLMNGDARPAEPKRRAQARGRIVTSYPYTDERGQILFEVVRLEPKDFRQRRPDGKGGWTWKLGTTRRVLYRLPDVLAANEVVIVEGEKDADRLRAAGFVATTNPGGAGKWRAEYTETLAGKRVAILPDHDEPGRQHALAVARSLHGKAASVRVIELAGLAEKKDVSDWLAAGHTADELRERIAKTPAWEPPAEVEEPKIIRLEAGELHRVVAQAAAALGRATHTDPFAGFYRMGNLLVRLARLADAAELTRGGIHRARGALVITAADPDALRLALTAAARWEKFDARSQKSMPTNAPADVAKTLLATAAGWSAIPILTGLVEAPTLRPDGTVLNAAGYDPATGLLFDPGGIAFPPVPERPTREQARAALATIKAILAGFPFADEASRSVAVSGLITPLVRKACRAVPLHGITAPKMASGKTLLATLAGYVAAGRAPALMSQASDPAEERKRLLAVLLEGPNVVVLDNVERELRSDALCTVLIEPVFSDRLLGVSRTVRASNGATFFATGNNLALAGDLTARAISCALDPGCERPEEREFAVDLHKVVPAKRAELAVAALIIVRAYLAAGEPKLGIPNFARFEDWSRFVRRPLVWLGMADPCTGRERIEGHDPVRAQLGALLEAWVETYPGEAVTVAEAVRHATREPTRDEPEADTEKRQRLLDALREIAAKGGTIDARSLGKFISKHERRFGGGLRFENAGSAQKITRWRVTQAGGFGGFRGLVPSPTREMSEVSLKDGFVGVLEANPRNPPLEPSKVLFLAPDEVEL